MTQPADRGSVPCLRAAGQRSLLSPGWLRAELLCRSPNAAVTESRPGMRCRVVEPAHVVLEPEG